MTTPETDTARYDYIIIGSGIAGLNTALLAAEHGSVLVVTKGRIDDCNSRYAQGGIAAAIGPGDSATLHERDTLDAGAGLCDPEAVGVLTGQGPDSIAGLIQWGVPFDTIHGQIALGREGAHSMPRILHAGGDATGQHIEDTLADRVRASERITVLEYTHAIRICVAGGTVAGVEVLDGRSGTRQEVPGSVVVVSTGGAGRLYRYTTNPEVATGDGVALAYLAGAEVMDMEFYQFHPTALWLEGAPTFLLSEAMRGEGAILRNADGQPFMADHHPMADLAPRERGVKGHRGGDGAGRRAAGDAGHIAPAVGDGDQPVSDDLRGVPAVRAGHYPGAHSGGAGGALHDGRRAHRHVGSHQHRRPVRVRRGGVRGGAWGQPAGQQLAAGHPGVLAAAGGSDVGERAGIRGAG